MSRRHLVYDRCDGQLDGDLRSVTLLSDASQAPQGLRGHQGILAMWGGALVQWESKHQPFAALSSTEAEPIGYVDAIAMGESLNNALVDDGVFLLKGDNLSGIQLLLSLDGPWRKRHLRLRSYVPWLPRNGEFENTPGAQLCADLL